MSVRHAVVELAVPSLCELGESPVWHPVEQVLYYCDIPAFRLYRFDAGSQQLQHWQFDTEVSACAPMAGGGLLLAMRDGLWRFWPQSGVREALANPPYDVRVQRFNDGKCDPFGEFWVSTVYEPRDRPLAALYRLRTDGLACESGGLTVGNGLAWSPDGARRYWSDTTSHTVFVAEALPDDASREVSRALIRFPTREMVAPGEVYGGRPDGAAVDVEGCYWVAMFEGQRLLRLSPKGEVLDTVPLPVRCPTMPCFGGADLRTLYITTARFRRPPDELAAQPWAGAVLSVRLDVPGLPATLVASR